MNRTLVLAACAASLALSACSQTATEPAAEETVVATTEAPAPEVTTVAADGKPSNGTFKVTMSDGTVVTEEVRADGTYVQTGADGKVTETGKWEQKAPETYCYTIDGPDAKQVCNTEGVDDKGVWTSTSPDGKTSTVQRVG